MFLISQQYSSRFLQFNYISDRNLIAEITAVCLLNRLCSCAYLRGCERACEVCVLVRVCLFVCLIDSLFGC